MPTLEQDETFAWFNVYNQLQPLLTSMFSPSQSFLIHICQSSHYYSDLLFKAQFISRYDSYISCIISFYVKKFSWLAPALSGLGKRLIVNFTQPRGNFRKKRLRWIYHLTGPTFGLFNLQCCFWHILFIFKLALDVTLQKMFTHTTVMVAENVVVPPKKPTTICRLVQDLPTHGRRGSQHELGNSFVIFAQTVIETVQWRWYAILTRYPAIVVEKAEKSVGIGGSFPETLDTSSRTCILLRFSSLSAVLSSIEKTVSVISQTLGPCGLEQ